MDAEKKKTLKKLKKWRSNYSYAAAAFSTGLLVTGYF